MRRLLVLVLEGSLVFEVQGSSPEFHQYLGLNRAKMVLS
jgi:hypothetical protein